MESLDIFHLVLDAIDTLCNVITAGLLAVTFSSYALIVPLAA